MFQGCGVPTDAFLQRFQNTVDVITQYGGSIGSDPGSVDGGLNMRKLVREAGKANSFTPERLEQATESATQKFLAVMFLMSIDRQHYDRLLEELENDFSRGHNDYPTTVTQAYNMVVEYKHDARNVMPGATPLPRGHHSLHRARKKGAEGNARRRIEATSSASGAANSATLLMTAQKTTTTTTTTAPVRATKNNKASPPSCPGS